MILLRGACSSGPGAVIRGEKAMSDEDGKPGTRAKDAESGVTPPPMSGRDAADSPPRARTAGMSRRRFTQASLGMAPVVLTLAHRPAMAASVCETPSGFESANLSARPREDLCHGGTPGYWRGAAGQGGHTWPDGYRPYDPNYMDSAPSPSEFQELETWAYLHTRGTRVIEVFDCQGVAPHIDDLTLMQALLLTGGGDRDQAAAHLVAALLNAASGWTDALNVATVKMIWNDHFCGGGFQPYGASTPWSGAQLVQYLQTTMTRG